ncbi:MAG: hypothetical protein ABR582_07285 [Gemmatimonadaceae bacterium]
MSIVTTGAFTEFAAKANTIALIISTVALNVDIRTVYRKKIARPSPTYIQRPQSEARILS